MNPEKESVKASAPDLNEDPITKEPGAHPVATGVGAAGAGTIGVAIGTAVAGPIGALVGAAVGAVIGGLGGSAVGEAIDPTDAVVTSKKDEPASERDLVSDKEFTSGASTDPNLTPYNPFGGLGAAETLPLVPVDYLEEEAGTTYSEAGEATPTSGELEKRAWSIYEAEGFPEGRALNHWVQAEEELKHY